jgi:glucose/arabinose dehydrogenase
MTAVLPAWSQTPNPHLVPHPVRLASGKTFSLNLPPGFDISIAAEGLHRVRFLTPSPDGRIFATDMHDLSDNRLGAVYILNGFNPKTGKFATVRPWLRRLRNPNNVAFYRDANGRQWLYLPLTDRLLRYRYAPGETVPTSAPEVLATYPDYGLSYKYGGWHLTRTVAFGQENGVDKLYVAVGSSCNECEEKEEIRATLSVMDPDGKNPHILARGLRNAVGLRYVNGTLYGTNMGADHLGDDAPDDTMFALDSNQRADGETRNYGWPYCYFKDGKVLPDSHFPNSPKRVDCAQVPLALTTFAAHGAPLGLEYFGSESNSELRDSFLVALHGSSKIELGRGYRLARVTAGLPPQDFLTGFLKDGVVYGRPCGILRLGPDAFLFTDDHSGVIYYVHRRQAP